MYVCQCLLKIYDNKKLLTCGGDFHNDTHRPKCGVYLDESLKDINEIVNYLKSVKEILG